MPICGGGELIRNFNTSICKRKYNLQSFLPSFNHLPQPSYSFLSLIYGCNFDATVSVHELLYISVICFGIALFSLYLKSFIYPQNNQALNFFLETSFAVPKIFFSVMMYIHTLLLYLNAY